MTTKNKADESAHSSRVTFVLIVLNTIDDHFSHLWELLSPRDTIFLFTHTMSDENDN